MSVNAFTCRCIAETIDGLCDGLCHFSGPSRSAVIYALMPQDPVCIYDPQHLLDGHETKFKDLYLDSNDWRTNVGISNDRRKFSHMLPEKNLQLAGLISYGGRSSSVFYQMWFTEHHPDLCCVGPTERWLEHAAWRFSHDIANEEELYTGISGTFLREYATHAVRDYVIDEMNAILGWDTQIRVYPILNAVMGISKTREEGEWPRGKLVFLEKKAIQDMEFVVKFPEMERPSLENFKHIRKLLQAVEYSDRKLVSDEKTVVGIAIGEIPRFHITADFQGVHGFLRLNGNEVCSFSDGSFQSTTHKAKLVQVEEALLESDMDSSSAGTLFKIIYSIVHHAERRKHGCTIVIDLNDKPIDISGQKLEQPLDLQNSELLDLTKALSKIDGALHIATDLNLHGFACLLDGRSIPGEDRSRGARYNSALRFTAEHDHIMVVVVSSDRPVSIIKEGVELSAQCEWKSASRYITKPLKLETWIAKSDL
jgi:sensor domain DACND-containing protein/sensor domain DACNH-containing protein/DisA checkpoint controller-like protein